ncbi:MAG: LysR family transcriptional regulator [Alphaproteobacteria bacterium]|nr:LysR family transcriptional regulator [Alphaproteobacteria bacterium]
MDDLLSELAAFRALIETGSLRTAANRVGLSTVQFGNALRRLEKRIGAPIVDRRNDAITSHGRELFDRAMEHWAALSSIVEDYNSPSRPPEGRLRIQTTREIAEMLLPDLIIDFAVAHPTISIECSIDERAGTEFRSDFDLAVRLGVQVVRGMACTPIRSQSRRWVTAGAPTLLAKLAKIESPTDLLNAPTIVLDHASETFSQWRFTKDGSPVTIMPEARLSASTMTVAREAARRGVGLIHAHASVLEADLASNSLVEVLSDWSQPIVAPYAYFPERVNPSPVLQAFLAHLN